MIDATGLDRTLRGVEAAWFEDGLAELAASALLAGLCGIFSSATFLTTSWTILAAGMWVLTATPMAGRWLQRRKMSHTAPRTGWVSFRRRTGARKFLTSAIALAAVLLIGRARVADPAVVLAALWTIASVVVSWRTGLRRFQAMAALGLVCAVSLAAAELPSFTALALATGVLATGAAILGGGTRARFLHLYREAA